MTAIKVSGMDYFNSILSNSLTIDADDIRRTLFEKGSSELLDSGVIAAFYERTNPINTINLREIKVCRLRNEPVLLIQAYRSNSPPKINVFVFT